MFLIILAFRSLEGARANRNLTHIFKFFLYTFLGRPDAGARIR